MHTDRHEVLEHFLQDVDEQISYKPMHAAINGIMKMVRGNGIAPIILLSFM